MTTVIRKERGLLYEDFEIGRTFEHHWGRTMTASESMSYSSITMNYNPIYFNVEYARRLGYEGIVINPVLVYTTVIGLSVEDLSEAGGPFLGVDDLRFLKPVYDGDTVTSRSVTLSRRPSASRPGWGIVEWRTTGLDQRGEAVLEFRRTNLSRMRALEATR
ncbi:MaoC family dehydratase [Nocardia sp. CA-120079]|uniref:MaoC family dehydratase n=1 Tax=Nocardia sp. CA-120079 TaxID=3239974 RepID=UPI003D98C601